MGHGCQKQSKVFSETKAGCFAHVFAQETSREVAEGETQQFVSAGYKFTRNSFRLMDRRTLQYAILLSNPIFARDSFVEFVKQNGNGFRCFDKPKHPTTNELAVER